MTDIKIFNSEKTADQYSDSPLFLGVEPGLFDTIHHQYPVLWDLYKEMKSLDWDENEFDFSQCNMDFKTCAPEVAEMMIRTLAWQWEADSIASRSSVSIMAPFMTSSEAWAAMQRISDNEVVHAATYSEIVRMSFDNPNEVLSSILSVKESITRLEAASKVFAEVYEASHKYALGLIPADQDLYNKIYLYWATMLMLERVQFMASFAITFTICGSGLFQPIGKAVQKIAQDELEVHSEFDKEILRIENLTERGQIAREQMRSRITEVFIELVNSECSWTSDYMFAEGRTLAGANAEIINNWVLYNAKPVADILRIDTDFKYPKHNPLPSMENWLNMNKIQAAAQEQDLAAYKIGAVINDDENVEFDIDF